MEDNYDFEGDFDRWINRSPEPPDTSAPAPSIDPTSARINYLDGVPDTFSPTPVDLDVTLGLDGDDYPNPGESLKRRRTLSDASIELTQAQAVAKRQRTSYATTSVPDFTSYHPASTTTSSSGSSTFFPSPAQFATPPLPFAYVAFDFGTGPSNDIAQRPPHTGPLTQQYKTVPNAIPRLACEPNLAQALVQAAPSAPYAAGDHYATPGPSNQASSHFSMMYPALYGDDQLQAHVGMRPAPVPAYNGFEAAVMHASQPPAYGIDFSKQSLQHGMGVYQDQNQDPPPAQVDSPATAPVHQCTDGCCPKPKRGRGSYRTAAGSATHTHGSGQAGSSASSNVGASTSSSPSNGSTCTSTSPEELRVPTYNATITPTQPQGPQRPWKVNCIFCGKAFTVTPRKNKGGRTINIMRWRMDFALQHFCGRSGRPGCAYWVACGVTSNAQPRQKRTDKGKGKAEGKGKGKKPQAEERVIQNVDALGRGMMAVYPEMADSGFDHPQFGDVVRGGLCKWWNGLTAPAKAELTGREVEEYEDEDEEPEKAEAGDDADAEGETDDEF